MEEIPRTTGPGSRPGAPPGGSPVGEGFDEPGESPGRTEDHGAARHGCASPRPGRASPDGSEEPQSLEQLLDRFCLAEDGGGRVTVGSIVRAVGTRSFGPLLLFAGVVLASPLSGIPGMTTTMGGVVLLVTGQLLLRRRHFWLPRWLLARSIRRTKLERAVGLLRRPARFVDRLVRPRLVRFVTGPSVYVIGSTCAIMALGVPMMELVPFSATTAGFALTAFGLSIIARDGLLALGAFVATGGVVGLILWRLL